MTPGAQLVAPEGFQCLPAGVEVYLLAAQHTRDRVLLVLYTSSTRKKNKKTGVVNETTFSCRLIKLSISDFRAALSEQLLVPSGRQPAAPPYLRQIGSQDPTEITKRRLTKNEQNIVNARLERIQPLVNEHEVFLLEMDPICNIRAFANDNGHNPNSIVLWTISYLMFGRQGWVLAPRWGLNKMGSATYNKQGSYQKTGRYSALGKHYGYPSTPEMRELCIKGYDKFQGLHVCMSTIYEKSLEKFFDVEPCTNQFGDHIILSKNGKPFPTFHQFKYAVELHYGRDTIQRNKLGRLHERTSSAVDIGSYREYVTNVFEKVSTDGAYSKTFPIRWDGGQTERLCVVSIVDFASGMPLGLGAAVGSEKEELYRSALFCCAIPKKKWFALYGFQLPDDLAWPSMGLPPRAEHDRLLDGSKWEDLDITDCTPSLSGKSKAISESKHDRLSKKVEERIHLESTLNPQEMIVAAGLNAIKKAHGSECTPALHPECLADGVVPTPVSYFNWMVQNGRTSAEQINFEEAVRRYLEPVELKATQAGVEWKSRRYVSEWVRESREYKNLARARSKLDGYYLSGCLRHIWVETSLGLEELEVNWTHASPPDRGDMTAAEAAAYDKEVQTAKAVQRRTKSAVAVNIRSAFQSQTGKAIDGHRVRPGQGNTAARNANSRAYRP